MGTLLKERSRITAKGQTTVPKSVRQALGVSYGGEIGYVVDENGVSLVKVGGEESDPVIESFLAFLARDMANSPGESIRLFPPSLVERLVAATDGLDVDPDAEIVGSVDL